MANRRVHAVIRGRVQGVSYRMSAVGEATRLGLGGWVRNRDDGTVELEAEGPADVVAALLSWCEVGPPAARVTAVEVEERTLTGERGPFRTRR